MLRGIRKASENWLGRGVMAAVMAVLAGSFAIWGINDIFRGFGRSALAKIGNVEISTDQFRQAYNDRLQQLQRQFGRPITPQQASALGLDRQVLGEMIEQSALDQRARQMNLGVSNDEISKRITSEPAFQNPNGQFDPARFQQILQSIGYSEQRFVTEQRQQMLRRQLGESLAGNVVVPKAWIDAVNQFQNEQRSISYVELGPAQAGDIPKPTDEQLSKYFDDRKTLFRAPEYRKIAVVVATPSEIGKWMEISDDDIKKAYEANKSRYSIPERRQVEQMVFPSMADAQAASDRIKAGTSFDAIAKERGLKSSDIDLGMVPKSGIIDPAVAAAAFSLKEGEVSAPIKGEFGAVLVTVTKIEPEVDKTLAEVAPQVRNDIAMERAKAQVQAIHDKIEDERGGGATLEEAAEKAKVPVVTIDAIDRSGRDPSGQPVTNLPDAPAVINAAFSSDVGVDNDPLDAEGGYIWYDVLGVTPARERSLDEVKAQVETAWRNDEIASRLKAKAADLVNKLKNGMTLDALAGADGVKVQTAADIKRGAPKPPITPPVIDAVFHTAKDEAGSAASGKETDWIVFRVTAIQTPALDPKSPEAASLDKTLQQQIADDLMAQYVARMEEDLGLNVNGTLLAQALGQSPPDTD